MGARRNSGQQIAYLTGIPSAHPCWHLTNDKMSRKKKLCCAIYATSQQRLRRELCTANVSSKLSVNDLQAKDSSLEDGRNVSEKQTNVRLLQSVHTKTKTKQKSVKKIISCLPGFNKGWMQKCQTRANMLMKTRTSF